MALVDHSRRTRCVEDPDGSYAERLQTAPDQHLRLGPVDVQREAMIAAARWMVAV